MRTAQQIFDTVVNHLRKQNAKSVALNEDGSTKLAYGDYGSPVCLYRSQDGKKCAAGAAITDEEYKPEMEGKNIRSILDKYNHLSDLVAHTRLLSDLQGAHDDHEVREWETLFDDISRKYDLIYTPPST